MNKQELEQAIRAANEAGARYRPVESIKPKVLANALAGFARGCPAGEVVALYDTTILSSGKTGFLVSTTAIYHDSFDFLLKKGGSKRLALDGLVGLEPDQELDFYQAVYADGSRQRLYLGKVYQNAVLPLLRVLLGAEPAAAPARRVNRMAPARCVNVQRGTKALLRSAAHSGNAWRGPAHPARGACVANSFIAASRFRGVESGPGRYISV